MDLELQDRPISSPLMDLDRVAEAFWAHFWSRIEGGGRVPDGQKLASSLKKVASTAPHVDIVYLIFGGKVCPKYEGRDPAMRPPDRDFNGKKRGLQNSLFFFWGGEKQR